MPCNGTLRERRRRWAHRINSISNDEKTRMESSRSILLNILESGIDKCAIVLILKFELYFLNFFSLTIDEKMIMIITCYYHISSSICVWMHIKQTAIVITRRSRCQDVRFFPHHSSKTHRQVSSFIPSPSLSSMCIVFFFVFF